MSKISELSDGGVVQGGDTLIAVRSGGNVKVSYGGSTTANIDGGTIDDTVIGGTTAAAVTTTALVATTADINGGTIDDIVIGGTTAAAGTFTTLTASGDMNIDNGTLFVDASDNAVGIGTSSPISNLDVSSTTNTTLAIRSSVAGSTASPKTMKLSFFGVDGTGVTPQEKAFISSIDRTINTTNSLLAFGVGGTEAVRIDSSRHLIVPEGITLGTAAGTYAAANTLDDYEEGTFTPAFTAVTNCSGISLKAAWYVKIGAIVHYAISGDITVTSSDTKTVFTFTNVFAQSIKTDAQGGSAFIQGSSSSPTATGSVVNASNNTSVAFVAFGAPVINFTGSSFFELKGTFKAD